MKIAKFLSLIVLVCLLFPQSVSSAAGYTVYDSDNQNYFVVKQSKTSSITIDGVLDESGYNGFHFLKLKHSDGLSGFGDIGIQSKGALNTKNETSVEYSMSWDASGFYFAFNVVDATPVAPQLYGMDGNQITDCVQLGLDFVGGKDDSDGIESALFFSFYPESIVNSTNAEGRAYVFEHMYFRGDSTYFEEDGVQIAGTRVDNGYIIEAFFPWQLLAQAKNFLPDGFIMPSEGDSFRYGVTIVDQYKPRANQNGDWDNFILVTNWKGGADMRISSYPVIKFIGTDLQLEIGNNDQDTPRNNKTNCNSALFPSSVSFVLAFALVLLIVTKKEKQK